MINIDSYTDASPRFFYRTPGQISSDIRAVSERISEINALLNVRNILAEVITAESEGNALRKIEAVNELLDFASEALDEMKELEETLDGLKKELCEALRNQR